MVITADYKFMALVMGVPPNIWSRTWKCLWGRQHCGSEPQLEPGSSRRRSRSSRTSRTQRPSSATIPCAPPMLQLKGRHAAALLGSVHRLEREAGPCASQHVPGEGQRAESPGGGNSAGPRNAPRWARFG